MQTKKGHKKVIIIIKKDNSFYGWCYLIYLGFVIVLLFKPQKLWNVIYLALVFVVCYKYKGRYLRTSNEVCQNVFNV